MAQKSSIQQIVKKKNPQGPKKYAAEKALAKQIKKQEKNIKHGKKGHTPVIRKILK